MAECSAIGSSTSSSIASSAPVAPGSPSTETAGTMACQQPLFQFAAVTPAPETSSFFDRLG
ncbi:MAG: hypothetical protein A2Y25_06995 [Candidatus Melainabacteria bacterium GWF2_37_15]|nr:MAG: hypothetical protein A2Y25_06995 [Candidatus Melainabacteria bacterium GWF2_37_15]